MCVAHLMFQNIDMPKKNDVFELDITDLTSEGAGVGRISGYPLFVQGAVPGDKIKALVVKDKRSYGYGKLIEIISPSPDRVSAGCDVFTSCGGCSLQMLSYEAQLRYKRKQVFDALTRIGGLKDPEVLPTIGMSNPYRYRNKAEYPVSMDASGRILMGFYSKHSHRIVECSDCLLGDPSDADILNAVRSWMIKCDISPYDEESGKGFLRHILIRHSHANGGVMICLVINSANMKHEKELVEALSICDNLMSLSYCINQRRDNVIMGDEVRVIYGESYIEDTIGGISFRISPQSFYQVNPEQTEKLYQTALSYAGLGGDEMVWDLYCGIGTISLFLAQKARKVCGVEIVPAAIKDAEDNAARNGITNTEFFCGKAEEVLPEQYEKTGERADVIVVDPPRKGCDASLLSTMLVMAPERIVYVSCNPATLARDIKILTNGGYRFIKAQPVDMFAQTVHVETVCLMSKV